MKARRILRILSSPSSGRPSTSRKLRQATQEESSLALESSCPPALLTPFLALESKPLTGPICRSTLNNDRSAQPAGVHTGEPSNYRSPKTYWTYLVFMVRS
jgi:hypothetical protein